jgi:acetyltransferase-like isoleucine patch superfamily enzyme
VIASRENVAIEFSSLVGAFMRLPLKQRITRAVRFARGLWLARRFDTRGLIDAGRRIKVVKHNGEICLDRYCQLGDNVHIAVIGDLRDRKALLHIGTDSSIGDRTKINVTRSMIIGNHCSISWDCDLRDTSWHRVRFLDRESGPISRPVVIEDHVWIGSHTIVECGVTIGANSVIAAGSRVIRDIPPNSFAAGNPARVIKEIAGWDRNPHKVGEDEGKSNEYPGAL